MDLNALNNQINKNRFQWKKAAASSWQARFQKQVSPIYVFVYQFGQGGHWVWQHILKPLSRPFWKMLKWTWNTYRWLWDQSVYSTDVYGIKTFAKFRAGLFITASFLTFFYIIPVSIALTYDTMLYAGTVKHQENLFLHHSQELDHNDNQFSIWGCDILPCSDQESMYLRVRSTAFNQIWSIFHHGSLFYPDFLAGAVPSVVSKCTITSYGWRWKFLIRNLDIYPDLLEVKSCEPTTYIMSPKT